MAITAAAGTIVYHTETKAVAGGGELVTVFADALPLITVLRDTAAEGDQESAKLRQVWLLTYARPTFTQRVAAAVPFCYGAPTIKMRLPLSRRMLCSILLPHAKPDWLMFFLSSRRPKCWIQLASRQGDLPNLSGKQR